jgi:hypothetical protein
MGWMTKNQGLIPGMGKRFFVCIVFGSVLGPTQSLFHWVPGALSQEIKQLGCEPDYSPSFSAKIEDAEMIAPLPYISSCCRA